MASRLRVGLVADVHYANRTGSHRYYREGLNRLSTAVAEFRRRSVDLVILLGDATDGGNGEAEQLCRVDEVAHVLAEAPGEALFVAGNHDLEDTTKGEFYDRMWSSLAYPHDAMAYEHSYAVDRGGFRFIFLDTHFDSNGTDWSYGNFRWQDAHVRSDHLAWAAGIAAGAPDAGVILITHEAVDYREKNGNRDPHVLSNHRAVWDAVSHGEDSLVRIVFQGHYHPGRLAHVRTAPVVTLAAMVEGAPPSTAFAIADIESEAVSIAGYGSQHSAQILMAECAMVD
jgi:predicted MPP superfamily phosphohydrolase